MKRMTEFVDEAADIPSEGWEQVLQSMKDDLDEGSLIIFSTEKTESWTYRLWMRLKEGR